MTLWRDRLQHTPNVGNGKKIAEYRIMTYVLRPYDGR